MIGWIILWCMFATLVYVLACKLYDAGPGDEAPPPEN